MAAVQSSMIDGDISLKDDNYLILGNGIIDLSPTPMLIQEVSQKDIINQELLNIADTLPAKNLYIKNNQDPNKDNLFFSSQNAYVPGNNILLMENDKINLLKTQIMQGVRKMLNLTPNNKNNKYTVKILNSWLQKYKDGSFLSPHNHCTGNMDSSHKYYSIAYYIDDGDPDKTQTYCGCVTFIIHNKLFHIRPRPGLLLIWPSDIVHLVNPFNSQSNKERCMLSTNVSVEMVQTM